MGIVLWRSFRDMPLDNGFQWAAAMAYYSVLSLIPLLLAVIITVAHIAPPEWVVTQARYFVGDMLPPGSERFKSFVQGAMSFQYSANILTVIALLLTSSRVFSVLRRALNIAYCTYEIHRYIKRTLIEMVMAATLGLLLILAFFSRYFFKLLLHTFGVESAEHYLFFRLSMEFMSAAALIIVLFIIYSRVSHKKLPAKATLVGAVTATCLILVIRPFFMRYIREFTDYNMIYGSLALAAILLFWAWIISLIVLYGGEVASHFSDMAIEGRSAEEVRLIHLERSATYSDLSK